MPDRGRRSRGRESDRPPDPESPAALAAALVPAVVDPPALERLSRYLGLLSSWNERTNLTGARTSAARVELLVRPVVEVASRLPGGSLLDVGSGNGSPGLVLAALRPESPATLLEPRARRWAFLREAARLMGLDRVDVRRQRHDDYDGPPAAVVTVRALRLPLAELAPLAAPGGTVVVWGARPESDPAFDAEDWGRPGVHAFRRRG